MSCFGSQDYESCGYHGTCISLENSNSSYLKSYCVCDPGYSHFPEFNFNLYLRESKETSTKIIRDYYENVGIMQQDDFIFTPLEALTPCEDKELPTRLLFAFSLVCCALALLYNIPALNSRRRMLRQIPLLTNMSVFISFSLYRTVFPLQIFGVSNFTSIIFATCSLFLSISTNIFILKFISYQFKNTKKGMSGTGRKNKFYSRFLKHSQVIAIVEVILETFFALFRTFIFFGVLKTTPEMSDTELQEVIANHRRVSRGYLAAAVYIAIRGSLWSLVTAKGFQSVIDDMRFIVEKSYTESSHAVATEEMPSGSQRNLSGSSSKLISFGSAQDLKNSVISKIRLTKQKRKPKVAQFSKDKTFLYCIQTIPMMESLKRVLVLNSLQYILHDSLFTMHPSFQRYATYSFALGLASFGITSGYVVHTIHFSRLRIIAATKKLAAKEKQDKK